jgi:nucleoside-diphosphate-sugar epimerase
MAADNRPKKVIVLGGDGFCGWPTSLHLSDQGHEVIVVDNLSRRKIDVELGCDSLTPIQSITDRVNVWNGISNQKMRFAYLDVATDYAELVQLIKDEKPDSIVHFAEQRAAPYSQKNARTKRYTVDNNVGGTNNLLAAIVESEVDVHVVHLGTMGVYGYGTSGGEIPEGYLDVILPDGREKTILHPAYPGSVYHLTKCMDALCFQFYNKNDGIRVTDLHQGIVWGTNTLQTARDERLINRFDYDGDYGTVLNRFLMQVGFFYFFFFFFFSFLLFLVQSRSLWSSSLSLLLSLLSSFLFFSLTVLCHLALPSPLQRTRPYSIAQSLKNRIENTKTHTHKTGGSGHPANSLRHGRTDARLHPHLRHCAVHRAGHQQPSQERCRR